MMFYAGIDWAANEHAVCVIDEKGKVKMRFVVPHSEAGMRELAKKLRGFTKKAEHMRIAIERPSGLLVDTLVEAGFLMVPIHPNVVKATRPRYSAAGGKSDPQDAYLLADILRTDGHRFKTLTPQSDETKALRTLSRTRDDVVSSKVALGNQLTALLQSFWAGAVSLFSGIDTEISMAFISRFPTPESASNLDEKQMTAFLKDQGYCGRTPAAELVKRLRAAPVGRAGPAEAKAKGSAVTRLVAVLVSTVKELKGLNDDIEKALEAHPDTRIIRSFPAIGMINAAQVLSELGDVRARFDSDDRLAAEAGVCPVTHSSGKRTAIVFRWACNTHLRVALTTWADNSRHHNAWAASVYAAAQARNLDHPHAIRVLARAWLRVLWRCWTNRTLYDEKLHGRAIKLAS